jgi:D-alanyl-D-alanine carboxypeptidase
MTRLTGVWAPLLVLALLLHPLTVSAGPAGNVAALLKTETAAHHVTGLACLVLKDGKPAVRYFAGNANLEWPSAVDGRTVFEIGSISKQFTAACILLLAQEGKLSLDDPIEKFLTNTPPAWRDVTVRQLLCHTAGLPTYDTLDGFQMRHQLTQAQFIARLAAHPMKFAPGTDWAYCNAAFNLAGYIVENVSGENYWEFLQRRIFDPLQMVNSGRRDPSLIIPHRAAGYVYSPTKGTLSNRDDDVTDLFAAGAIVSTADDLAKWDLGLLAGNVLRKPWSDLWWTPSKLNNGSALDFKWQGRAMSYGLGWFIDDVNGHRDIGHTGITSGFSAANELFPEDHLAIIILSNTDEGFFAGNVANKIAHLLLTPSGDGRH